MVKKVKIGGSVFGIKYVENLKDGNDNLYGHIEYGDLLITVNDQHHKTQQRKTILHEMIHALSEENCLNWNEKMVTIISNNIFSLLIDNKEFFKDVLNGN